MQSKEVADKSREADAVVERLDRLGRALIAIHETGAEHSNKTDLLDEVVLVIRRRKRPDECIREIASLMRVWQIRIG